MTQASSGNTSIKVDDVLWIKGSGKWLVNAEEDFFFLPISLAEWRPSMDQIGAHPASSVQSVCESGAASSETAMHAVLPQKVVVHVHSVNTVAWAVREDGPVHLGERLGGLTWRWIPYTASGASLARKIGDAGYGSPEADVFVLGNHGLVVCGSSCDAVYDLLMEVEERLCITPRAAPEPNRSALEGIVAESGWSLPVYEEIHDLATDEVSQRILSGGILYPCQAIFLPGSTRVLAAAEPDVDTGDTRQPVEIVKDAGVLVSQDLTRAEFEMLNGLRHVVQRVDGAAPIRYLSDFEVENILQEEAHHYRQTVDANFHPVAEARG